MRKGFSLVVLTIIVTVVLILVTATTFSVVNAQKKIRRLEFANEIARVQEKVDLYYNKNQEYPVDTLLGIVNIDISSLSVQEQVQFEDEEKEGNNVYFNYIKLNSIFDSNNSLTDELHSLKYGNGNGNDDKYIVSANTGKVYYLRGMDSYYTLTDELKLEIDYVENTSKTSSYSNIIFTKNNDEYTNQPITTTIKIPNEYVVVSCKVIPKTSSGSDLALLSTDENYKNYQTGVINDDYDIAVIWKEDATSTTNNTTVFSVNNYDNVKPEIEVVGNKKSQTVNLTQNSNNFYYISYFDDDSGIDVVKYAEIKLEGNPSNEANNLEIIRKHMSQNGIAIAGNTFDVSTGTRWVTIYVRDKAGNEQYAYKQVPEEERTVVNNYQSSIIEPITTTVDTHDQVQEPTQP